SSNSLRKLYYFRVPEYWRRTEKLKFLEEKGRINNVEWEELQPDEKYTWLTEGMHPDFSKFLPIGTKETKSTRSIQSGAIFKLYSPGVNTARDSIVYGFDLLALTTQIKKFMEN